MRKALVPVVSVLLACGTASAASVYGPAGEYESRWTKEEEEREMAQRTVHSGAGSSHHVMRLRGAEPLHAHDAHDLTVFALKGKSSAEVGGNHYALKPGNVLHIPRGAPHRVRSEGRGAAEVYAVFVPEYDGKDRRLILENDQSK